MNSLLEVSTKILALVGSDSPSEFRLNKLKNLPSFPENIDFQCQEIYLCKIQDTEEISDEDLTRLFDLLKIKKDILSDYKSSFFITPRLGTISPWSSKATEIIQNCGLKTIERVERGMGYFFNHKIPPEQLSQMGFSLYDKMTQQVLTDIRKTSELFSISRPGNLKDINIFSEGKNALEEANRDLGLALSEDEIHYLYENYSKTNKNPTDAELMMFAQANSEHCRHKIFNASWSIDGEEHLNSLFDMIRNTYHNYSEGIISAYEDNAAILKGNKSLRFYPVDDRYGYHEEDINLVIKVETHDHPTAISPFSGASTGSGGEIRDEGATGIGAKPKAGLTGFSVSSLRIPSLTEKWETKEERPERISSPLNIMIEAPIGAASFNNEFGRPNILGYFRSYENKTDSHHYGYHKPIMLAGGLGNIKTEHVFKKEVPIGSKLIVLGGPAMLIGLGGGSASSLSSGEGDSDLDYASVQRENPEMERRCQEVLDRCWQSPQNPILFIHDVGAGGLSNAIPELAKDCHLGANIDLRKIPLADNSMSALEIWSNESQERYVLAVEKNSLKEFKEYCVREKCPYAVVGTLTSKKIFKLRDSKNGKSPINLPMETIFGYQEENIHEIISDVKPNNFSKPKKINLKKSLLDVLRHPTVGSKSFLINIGDRSVGGLTYRDQFVGPHQIPVADHAITLSDFNTNSGEAMAMGEKSPIAITNPTAAGKLALAEAVINLLPAGVAKLSDIKISANWMASPDDSQRKSDLFNTVKELTQKVCKPWRIAIPVGKDSLSMKTIWQNNKKTNLSPQSLVISAFAKIKNVSNSITPQLINKDELVLVYLDLSKNKKRLGGSILAEVTQQTNLETPNLENLKEFPRIYNFLATNINKKRIYSFHDISDGGLVVSAVEMMLAGGCGLNLDFSKISFFNDSSNLFSEELGVLFQINNKDFSGFKKDFTRLGLKNSFFRIGSTNDSDDLCLKTNNQTLRINHKELMNSWSCVSYNIKLMRDNKETTKQEHKFLLNKKRSKLFQNFNFKVKKTFHRTTPKIAILRDQGVNSHLEMAAAFSQAGFKVIDLHMRDLFKNSNMLNNFKGLAFPGGFSYGDVLGAGKGWAQSIKSNTRLKEKFIEFFHRQDTFALGICNGCQVMSELKELIPGSAHWPKLERNDSNRFEARLVQVRINKSNSNFFKDMEGAQLLVPVNHGEGKMVFPKDTCPKKMISDNLVPLQFCTNKGTEAKEFPENPNGSVDGITAVTNTDGRFLIMMPHPERSFLNNQLSWTNEKGKYSPWFRLFLNSRKFYS